MNTNKNSAKLLLLMLCATLLPLWVNAQNEEWSEWNHLGTAVTASGKESMIATFQNWGTESVVAWDEPITIDQRTNVADPTKHQLRLNDIFNGKDIILDYDSSTAKITAQNQSTGYTINKDKLQGYDGVYDEFIFSLSAGTYIPVTGLINLSKAFFFINNGLGFNLGFTLQIEGVTPPTFTGSWDRKYVGREGGEATLTLTFDAPIVKYRMMVIAPGEQLSSSISELYKANPVTDLNYVESDETTVTITCDKIGTYRVVFVPIDADGTAVFMNHTYAHMVSYAEPEYDSYVWNYIGESTVIESMGSNLITTDQQWIEVDGNWVNKYPWQATVEGVKTYRRADNPNIIGLRNLYGANHPYGSTFKFVDQTIDWWIYIDVTNPEDVKMLTTPVGAWDGTSGYATFINQYSNHAAATYADGVITFPFYTLAMGVLVNQDQMTEFDFKVILPDEDTNTDKEDDTTSIDATQVEGIAPSAYYDLSGRHVEKPTKGIYIVDGKKVIL